MTDDLSEAVATEETPAAQDAQKAPARPARWRRWLAWTLLVLGTVLLLATSANLWIKRQALDTDSWVDTSGQLLANDEIRGALSAYVVDQLFENVDISTNLADTVSNATADGSAESELLGPLVVAVGPLLENALREVSISVTDRVLGSAGVQQLWSEANRVVHSALVAVVTEDSSIEGVDIQDGTVTLDLKPILLEVGTRLGIDVTAEDLPQGAGEIVILESSELGTVQTAVKTIQTMSVLLVLIVLGLFGLAIYLPKGERRRMMMACAGSLVFTGIILLVVKAVAGQALVNALADNALDQSPVGEVWGIATGLLVDIAQALILYGVALFLGAWVAGPSRPAVAVRRWLAPSFRHRPVLVFGVIALIFLVALLWTPTSSNRELWGTLALAVLAVIGIEALRRQTNREYPDTVPLASASGTASPSQGA